MLKNVISFFVLNVTIEEVLSTKTVGMYIKWGNMFGSHIWYAEHLFAKHTTLRRTMQSLTNELTITVKNRH